MSKSNVHIGNLERGKCRQFLVGIKCRKRGVRGLEEEVTVRVSGTVQISSLESVRNRRERVKGYRDSPLVLSSASSSKTVVAPGNTKSSLVTVLPLYWTDTTCGRVNSSPM